MQATVVSALASQIVYDRSVHAAHSAGSADHFFHDAEASRHSSIASTSVVVGTDSFDGLPQGHPYDDDDDDRRVCAA